MRFCEPHWDGLREAIVAQPGLEELVAEDGATAVRQMKHELETRERSIANFDPLMAAHWAIVNRIAEHAPGVIFIDGCPLCWVADEHEKHCREPRCTVTRQTFEDWIPSVAEFMRTEAERLLAEEKGGVGA